MEFKSCKRVVKKHANSELTDLAISLLQVEIVKREAELWFQDQKCGTLEDEINELNKRIDAKDLREYEKSDLRKELNNKKLQLENAEWDAYHMHLAIERYRKHLNARTTLPVE